ncbi:hypothetical protein EV363DRAFT_1531476 [Boletus edulis]|nr:hypothetical protein EV363DRAFT_1531476 [Boletus edulis]
MYWSLIKTRKKKRSSDEDDYGEPEHHEELETHHSQDRDDAVDNDGAEQCNSGTIQLVDAEQCNSGTIQLVDADQSSNGIVGDMETEDGVLYGRSHYAERARRRANVSSPAMSAPGFPLHHSSQLVHDSPSTPLTVDSSMDVSSGLDIPLERSTHVKRARQEHQVDEVEADVNMTPSSPSPAKKPARSEHSNRDSLIPRFELQLPRDESSPKIRHSTFSIADPFSISNVKEEVGELSFTSFDDPLDPTNLSIGQSKVSLSKVQVQKDWEMGHCVIHYEYSSPS